MGNQCVTPVIARVVFLGKKRRAETGRSAYALLIIDDEGRIIDRPFTGRSLADVVAFVKKHRSDKGWSRVKFDAPDGIDRGDDGSQPRRYETLTLHEIFYASPALGQS